MAKTVEISFAIGAALTGSFNSAFGRAGQSFQNLQKQMENLQQQSGQITNFQKLQETMTANQSSLEVTRQNYQELESQISASKQNTAGLKSQYGESQAEIERLNASLIRNKDAYQAAKLNVQSLENQITHATGPTAELQKRYAAAQEEVRRLGGVVKQNSGELSNARMNAKRLNTEMQASAKQTKKMQSEAKELKTQADKLQTGLDRDREALAKMRTELSAAGVDTSNLTQRQAQLEEQTKRAADAQTRLQNAQRNFEAARQQLSWNNIKSDVITSAGLAYSLYKPVRQAADFESAMARLNAVAFSGGGRDKAADAEALKQLAEQARELGRSTKFTAVEVANSQENLARAGFKANEIIAAMPGLLSMAAAEGMDLSSASDIAASTLRGFHLPAEQMNRVADVLAQTSAASNTNIVGLGESMKMVAPVAASLGVSIEETSAMLGVMANNGIKGTESGTALRNAFLRLSQEPKAVEKALTRMGVASRTANGNMRKLPSIMLELAEKMKDMGEADKLKNLADIFGVRSAAGMLAVMEGVVDGSLSNLERYNKEATGIVRTMAEATGASLEEMRAGMQNSEKMADKVGVSFRDLSIYTAMLAKNGIKGATADLILSGTFSKLAKEPAKAEKALKKYGVAFRDAKGNMREMPDLLMDINNAMINLARSGVSPDQQLKALSGIFGVDEGTATGIQILLREMGSSTFSDYGKKADTAKGVSYEMMKKQLATFKGQWDIAASAVQDFMVEVGNVLLPYATKIVESFGKITAEIVYVMKKFPVMTRIVVTGLGAIATLKIVDKVSKIGGAILKLPFAWLEVANAARDAHSVTESIGSAAGAAGKKFSGLWGIVAAHPFMALLTVSALILTNWKEICEWIEKAINWSKQAGAALSSPEFSQATKPVSMGGTKQKAGTEEYHIQQMNSMFAAPEIKQRAKGGIITRAELAVIGEAGREAIIPLEKQGRGTELWIEAGKELGLINNVSSTHDVLSSVVNALRIQPDTNISTSQYASKSFSDSSLKASTDIHNAGAVIPHAAGGIFSQPHVGLVAEAGREAIIPLEKQGRGTELWIEAGRKLGLINNVSSTHDVLSSVVNALRIQPDTNISTSQYASKSFSDSSLKTSTDIHTVGAVIPHAAGGIFSQPHVGLVAEAGREAIIPLEKQGRGTELWIEAGKELGLINNVSSTHDVLSSVVNALRIQPDTNISTSQYASKSFSDSSLKTSTDIHTVGAVIPHAAGGIFSQPHVGLVAEAGREAIIPLEKQGRGTELWIEAGKELGLIKTDFNPLERDNINILNRIGAEAITRPPTVLNVFNNLLEGTSDGISLREAADRETYISGSTTNTNNSPSIVFAPNITVTIEGGNTESEQQYRQITMEMFEDMARQLQEQIQRVSFD